MTERTLDYYLPMCEKCNNEVGSFRVWNSGAFRLLCLSCLRNGETGKTLKNKKPEKRKEVKRRKWHN